MDRWVGSCMGSGWLDGWMQICPEGWGNLWYRKVFTKVFIKDEFLHAVIQWKDRLQVRR